MLPEGRHDDQPRPLAAARRAHRRHPHPADPAAAQLHRRHLSHHRRRDRAVPRAAALTFLGDKAMSTVISILITFLVVILVLYLVDRLPIDGRAKYIIRIIVIIIGILSLLRAITAFPI